MGWEIYYDRESGRYLVWNTVVSAFVHIADTPEGAARFIADRAISVHSPEEREELFRMWLEVAKHATPLEDAVFYVFRPSDVN